MLVFFLARERSYFMVHRNRGYYMNCSKDLTDLSKLEEVLAEKLPLSSPVQGK